MRSPSGCANERCRERPDGNVLQGFSLPSALGQFRDNPRLGRASMAGRWLFGLLFDPPHRRCFALQRNKVSCTCRIGIPEMLSFQKANASARARFHRRMMPAAFPCNLPGANAASRQDADRTPRITLTLIWAKSARHLHELSPRDGLRERRHGPALHRPVAFSTEFPTSTGCVL